MHGFMNQWKKQMAGMGKPNPSSIRFAAIAATRQTKHPRSSGFTLLELMVAIVILTIAMSIAFEAFSATIRGWKRGTEVFEGIKHGDFAMNQIASALNSTFYFANANKIYAFKAEKNNLQGLPADEISFVTANGAFMPTDSPLSVGPHRLNLYIDNDDDGNPALFVLAMPAIADYEEYVDDSQAEPMLVSRAIQGFEIMFWDKENEDWTDEWDKENSIPERIYIAVFVPSDDEYEEPIKFERIIEIPVFGSLKARLSAPMVQYKIARPDNDEPRNVENPP